jgi:DNA modification methylase
MTSYQLKSKTIYCGDNLRMLKDIPDESIDLCYIDPPFNSNRNYEVFWGDVQEKRAFNDRFGDAEAYINYMRPRVNEIYRVLKKTGSFYYHCDWHASHYVKIMLDQIFGFNNFQNEIIWKRTNNPKGSQFKDKRFGVYTDSIFFYAKTDDYVFELDRIKKSLTKFELEAKYPYIDEKGRYYQGPILRGDSMGERPNLVYEYKGYIPGKAGWRLTKDKLIELDSIGNLGWSKNGKPFRKLRIDDDRGNPIGNLWDDIPRIYSSSEESLGYPTQKPIALLERIIEASSNKGDVVLDAFCGCGTTLVAAEKLKRNWIGIDISPTSCRVMSQRLYELFKFREGKDFWVEDLPKTEHELRELPHFEFQNWAVIALGQLTNTTGIPNKIKSGDFGIDGRLYPIELEKKKIDGKDLFGDIDKYYPVQVKQMDKVGRPDIDNFYAAIKRDGRNKGFFVSFDFSRDAETEVKRLWKEGDADINLIKVESLLKAESIR